MTCSTKGDHEAYLTWFVFSFRLMSMKLRRLKQNNGTLRVMRMKIRIMMRVGRVSGMRRRRVISKNERERGRRAGITFDHS